MSPRRSRSVSATDILYGEFPRQPAADAAPAEATQSARAWGRGPLGEEISEAHSYVVVEEVDDDNVTLVIAPWPEVDPEGGSLRFGPEEGRGAAVADRPSLQAALRERTTLLEYGERGASPELAEREIAAGDVFAIELAGEIPGTATCATRGPAGSPGRSSTSRRWPATSPRRRCWRR
jgi:hypothetical protein